MKLKRHGGSLNHPKGNTGEDGGRDNKTNMSRVALSAYTKTTFWAYARASLRPRIPNKLQDDVRIWLSPPNPWKNHNLARGSRHTGTAAWFVAGSTLPEWKSLGPRSLLWIHGKRESSNLNTFAGTDDFTSDSGCRKECSLVC